MTNVNNDLMAGWGAIDAEENNGGNGGGNKPERPDFLKLSIGDTKIRVLDMIPFSYKEWYIPKANGGSGSSIGYFAGGADLLEKANQAHMKKIFAEADKRGLKDKARKDFLRDAGYKKQPYGKVKDKNIIHVLDRATGEVKLLDKGNGVFKELKKYAMNPEYGDLRNYDITITMAGDMADFQTIEYSVTPARSNSPLTEAEIALYEAKKIDLKAFKTPSYTPEQALLIANGATYADVLGNGSDTQEEVNEKADDTMLPPQEDSKEEGAPVDVEKGEALTEEELANVEF